MNAFSFDFAGSTMTWEYKKFAHLCDSSIYATWGNTAVNVMVLRGPAKADSDFFPLQVEYLEKYFASGKIKGSNYDKREGFPSEEAILKGRVIDRAIRPRFPKGILDTVQLYVTVLSYDPKNDPLTLAYNAAVAAFMTSDIPFEGELSGLRISLGDDGKPFVNAIDITSLSLKAHETVAPMNMFLGLDKNGVTMFDADMDQVPEEKVKECVRYAKEQSEVLWKAQVDFAKQFGLAKKEGTMQTIPEVVIEKIESTYMEELQNAVGDPEKQGRKDKLAVLADKLATDFKENSEVQFFHILAAMDKEQKKLVRKAVFENGHRIDGRQYDEIRALSAEVGVLKRAHGSAIFKRGDTHLLSVATLASPAKALMVEDYTGDGLVHFIHEYEGLPYAYGEPGRMAYKPGRRDTGHGALGEKAVERVIPSQQEFPYMIRVVSEIMTEAGSTSMGSISGACMALMDAGVPIKAPVAGISVGVIADETFGQYHLLTDIAETEDFFGEMDFKVAGTETGINAIQMDTKRLSIPYAVIEEAIDAAKKGRQTVLDLMKRTIPTTRTTLSEFAPQIETVQVDPDKLGKLIGPGGKMIKEITRLSGMDLNIKDDGTVEIFGAPAEARAKAKELIDAVFEEFKVGETYDGMILENRPFGSICKIVRGDMEGKGLIHVSELADGFVKNPDDIVKPGQRVRVKVVGIDDMGRLKLSLKQAQQN
ncbi:polyribonucleotide nucleotidyltransferase [bacterium]|nr:polyribonucleotide nucleotidyltransferase [bacterium]